MVIHSDEHLMEDNKSVHDGVVELLQSIYKNKFFSEKHKRNLSNLSCNPSFSNCIKFIKCFI